MTFITSIIKPKILDKNIDELLRSDFLDFLLIWRIGNVDELCISILKDTNEDECVSHSAINLLASVINYYDFPDYYPLLSDIMNSEEYYNNVKLSSLLLLLRFTNNPQYVTEIEELITYDSDFLKNYLKNYLSDNCNQSIYFYHYDSLLKLTN